MKLKHHMALLAVVGAAAASGAASTSAWGCGMNPHDCGNGGGPKAEERPGCGYGDTRPHTGPPGIMKKGGFDQDQPANEGGPKECPAAAGGNR